MTRRLNSSHLLSSASFLFFFMRPPTPCILKSAFNSVSSTIKDVITRMQRRPRRHSTLSVYLSDEKERQCLSSAAKHFWDFSNGLICMKCQYWEILTTKTIFSSQCFLYFFTLEDPEFTFYLCSPHSHLLTSTSSWATNSTKRPSSNKWVRV